MNTTSERIQTLCYCFFSILANNYCSEWDKGQILDGCKRLNHVTEEEYQEVEKMFREVHLDYNFRILKDLKDTHSCL